MLYCSLYLIEIKFGVYLSYKNGFKSYLQLERGMSENTLMAYLQDIGRLFKFLIEDKNSKGIQKVDLSDLTDFLTYINKSGLEANSQARIISGIRAFFKYLVLEQIIDKDPSELLDSPQLGRKLPEVLNIDDISKLIDSMDLSQPEGERNKAILETLYGCGLRVSELINLQISDLYFKERIISVSSCVALDAWSTTTMKGSIRHVG